VLFNAFIFAQLANLVNSRRINDEYNIFQNITHSPVFVTVLLICAGLQVRRGGGCPLRALTRLPALRCAPARLAPAPAPRQAPDPAAARLTAPSRPSPPTPPLPAGPHHQLHLRCVQGQAA
jgi:hypothetical protein